MQPQLLSVGVDVSKAKLDASFLDSDGRMVHGLTTVPNTPPGWDELKALIASVARQLGEEVRVLCTMESTSYMHRGVAAALRDIPDCAVDVYVANPRSTNYFAKALLRDCKTDHKDSVQLAEYGLRMRPQSQEPLSSQVEQARDVTRTRRRLVEERTSYVNRTHKFLGCYYPGYEQVLGTKHLAKGLLVVLSQYPTPRQILEAGVETLAKLRTGPRHYVGAKMAQKLVRLAEQAPVQELSEAVALVIVGTVRHILELDTLIKQLDRAIEKLLEEVYPDDTLTTIPGIGPVTAASILAEVGDIRRFPSKRQFVGYCGLYPTVWQSGQSKRYYRMTHKGNRMLKMALLVASASARQYNPVIRAYYERLRARGKSKKAAGGAVARKLAELVYTLLSRGEKWSEEKALKGLAKAEQMAASAA